MLSRSASNAPYAVASTSSVETEDVSVWCSNDYLGMSNHPRVSSAVVEAIKSNGVGLLINQNIRLIRYFKFVLATLILDILL